MGKLSSNGHRNKVEKPSPNNNEAAVPNSHSPTCVCSPVEKS